MTGRGGARAGRLRRSFTIGVVACLVVLAAAAWGVHLTSAGRHRPEGTAERWLAAVSDTTRTGVADDARRRADRIGPVALANQLVSAADPGGKAAFDDLEVGKAVKTAAGGTAVPFHLHLHAEKALAGSDERYGLIGLAHPSGERRWVIRDVAVVPGPTDVPSRGGPPPSRAGWTLWIAAVVGGVVLTTLASLAVRWAGREAAAGVGSVTR